MSICPRYTVVVIIVAGCVGGEIEKCQKCDYFLHQVGLKKRTSRIAHRPSYGVLVSW